MPLDFAIRGASLTPGCAEFESIDYALNISNPIRVSSISRIDSHSLSLVEESPVPAPPALIEQCFNRVEYYQPLYGVTGIEGPLRSCRDRAVVIEAALDSLGRRFSLVDFGSSLGFFPFFFADRGAQTTGVDINPETTAVAIATQRVNGLSATFKTAPLDLTTVSTISPGQYDVALALTMLHHITLRRGMDNVTQLVAELLARIPTLIVELAHRDEDVSFAWRESLPKDPLEILSVCGNIQIQHLGDFSSYLSSSVRPMYLVKR
jgi:O-antigen chain-terminating methyltransferase